jgi:nicotinamide-nucleotide amidase
VLRALDGTVAVAESLTGGLVTARLVDVPGASEVLMGADWGIATTGNAGPEPSEGKPVGLVHVGVAGPHGVVTEELNLSGGRLEIREQTVDAVLSLLVARLGEESTDDRR